MTDTTTTDTAVLTMRQRNPYVGPRAFRKDELFFGREVESAGLLDKLLPGGVMLLHSPSGAGKTSLIQASVVPEFLREGFQICSTLPPATTKPAAASKPAQREPRFAALRVNLPPPEDLEIGNRYVFSIANGLVGNLVDRRDAAKMSIEDALDTFARLGPPPENISAAGVDAAMVDEPPHDRGTVQQLVVIDQLEETLTLNPSDLAGQTEFFRQLGFALRRGRRWGLLAMREDHMGGIDKFKRFFQNELRTTYRIDYLDGDSALRAVQNPAAARGVVFEDAAARLLVADLRGVPAQIRPQGIAERSAGRPQKAGSRSRLILGRSDAGPPYGSATGRAAPVVEVEYPFVVPVLLQVICDSLWRILSKEPDASFDRITVADLDQVKPYGTTLSKYYRNVVREASGKNRDIERVIRDWIDGHLLTPQGTRRPTAELPPLPPADQTAVVNTLASRYLIRDDPRPGGVWWELTHDLLVQPIIDDNLAWRSRNLKGWQVVAHEWDRTGRPREYLLRGAALREARSGAKRPELTQVETEFLEESRRVADEAGRLARLEYQLSISRIFVVLSVLLNLVLGYELWLR